MVPGWGEREVVVGGWQGGGKGGEACQLCQGSSRREGEPCWYGGEEGLDDVVVRLCEGEVGVVVGRVVVGGTFMWPRYRITHFNTILFLSCRSESSKY